MFIELATRIARSMGLKPDLVCAICERESSWNPWAARYEPAFYSRYVMGRTIKTFGACSKETESQFLATSWGLMQVMGQVARERKYTGTFLSGLCDPEAGVSIGCTHLASLLTRHPLENDAIAAYNAGSPRRDEYGKYVNQPYVDGINALRTKYI